MSTLYLTEQGSVLKKSGERLIVEKDDLELLEVQAFKVDNVLVFGNIQVTTQALTEILEHGITLSLLTLSGKLKGYLSSPKSKNVELRMAQYEKHKDFSYSLRFSKRIVEGKIVNSISVLRRFFYNHPEACLSGEIKTLEEILDTLTEEVSTERLFGLEGIAAKTYFSAFGRMCIGELKFDGRRRPATDPINALLSFGYTLVLNEIRSLIEALGLDPYLGFFHKMEYGRPSLALDILEEFRAPVVDRLTLTLVNKGIFKEDDFILDSDSGSIHLKRESLKEYFVNLEKALVEEFRDAKRAEKTNLRKCFRYQVEAVSRAILRNEEYIPFRFE